MRQLKFHEQKLLKKVDFLQWKSDQNIREVKVLRRYRIQNREDYVKYNRLCGHITQLATKLKNLKPDDDFRMKMTDELLNKVYNMGLIPTKKSLGQVEKIAVSAFCRRRVPVVMVRIKMAENLKEATELIEQGHVRIGPTVITDPAHLVTRSMEDFLTWVDSSKIKRTVMRYNDKLDDYELLGN